MRARIVRWLFATGMLLCLGGMVACGGRGAPVQSPVVVHAGQTFAQTEAAVREVLARRHWVVEQQQPGRVVAYIDVRTHRLRVDIRYDAENVNVYYVDSNNLKAHLEPDGQVYAHPKVNVWIRNLASDIAKALAIGGAQPATSGASTPVAPEAANAAPGQS